jgi:REP-associated tyrosine transposase
MRHRLFVHLVWTTADRTPTIGRGTAEFLERQLPLIATQERAEMLAVGIVTTHVHLLLRLHPATIIPRLVQRLKGSTSHGWNAARIGPTLRWSKGYTAQSVSERALIAVAEYVEDQARHHPDQRIER